MWGERREGRKAGSRKEWWWIVDEEARRKGVRMDESERFGIGGGGTKVGRRRVIRVREDMADRKKGVKELCCMVKQRFNAVGRRGRSDERVIEQRSTNA